MYIQPNEDSSADADNIETKNYDAKFKSLHIDVSNPNSCPEYFQKKSPDNCRFEEVEIKLEEMFAGIDDEQSIHINNKRESLPNIIISKNYNTSVTETLTANILEKPIQTKAAVKLTECIISTKIIKYKHSLDAKSEIETENNRTVMKKNHPHEKMSVGIDQSEKQAELNFDKTNIENKILLQYHDNNPESNTNNVPTNSNIVTKKNKSLVNRKHVGEMRKHKNSKSKSKKKKISKSEEQGVTKVRQQKFKNRHINNYSSSDNENEPDERTQQSRDIDTKYRSPFVFIKNDGKISIVNTATPDDSAEKTNKFKKISNYAHERKNVKGTYSSTLSNKYDADTADSTWVCVFCKRGPHKKGLGDLFGPYVVSMDCDEYRIAANVNIVSSIRVSKGTSQPNATLYSPIIKANSQEMIMLERHDCLDSDIKNGHQNGVSGTSPNNIEIWFHEDCAVWAPNIFLVGSRLVGLESAIWNSTVHKCAYCGRYGAAICCLQRDCKETSHLICARENNWLLNEFKLWAYCAKHILLY